MYPSLHFFLNTHRCTMSPRCMIFFKHAGLISKGVFICKQGFEPSSPVPVQHSLYHIWLSNDVWTIACNITTPEHFFSIRLNKVHKWISAVISSTWYAHVEKNWGFFGGKRNQCSSFKIAKITVFTRSVWHLACLQNALCRLWVLGFKLLTPQILFL